MSRRLAMALLGGDHNHPSAVTLMADSVVGALVTEGCKLPLCCLIEILMPVVPPYPPLIERAAKTAAHAIVLAEEAGLIVLLGKRAILTQAGMRRGEFLFGMIVAAIEEEANGDGA